MEKQFTKDTSNLKMIRKFKYVEIHILFIRKCETKVENGGKIIVKIFVTYITYASPV